METENTPLNQALENCKQQALCEFVKQLIPLLDRHSWRVEHLLLALSEYLFLQKDWDKAVKHLEDASMEISRSRRT